MRDLISHKALLITPVLAAVFLSLAPPALSEKTTGRNDGREQVSSPEDADIKRYLAHTFALLEKNDFQQALEYTDLILRKAPSCGQAYLMKGYALFKLEKPDQAVQAIQHGLALLPNYGKGVYMVPGWGPEWSYHILACALHDSGKVPEAIKSIDKALNYYNDKPILYEDRGTFYFQLKQYGRAIEDYTIQIKYDQHNYYGYYNRARAYLAVKKPGQAIADLNTAIEKDPKDSIMYSTRGDAYKLLGQPDLAKKDYEKAKHLSSVTDFAP